MQVTCFYVFVHVSIYSHSSNVDFVGLHNPIVFSICQLLNKTTEFEAAVRKVLSDVRLDNDIVVSVFETNIRVLG